MTEQIIEATFRAIYICRNRNCKNVFALEYRTEGKTRYGSDYGTRELKAGEQAAPEDRYYGGRRAYSDDMMGLLRCPECKVNLPKGGQVRGTYSESHKCNAKCLAAKGQDCECQCNGANHGANHL